MVVKRCSSLKNGSVGRLKCKKEEALDERCVGKSSVGWNVVEVEYTSFFSLLFRLCLDFYRCETDVDLQCNGRKFKNKKETWNTQMRPKYSQSYQLAIECQ